MPSLLDPAIFVHAQVGEKPVVTRALKALGVSHAAAVGHLVMFWGAASLHTTDGALVDVSDEQIERWAVWTGKRGVFARFIRAQHVDADGRIREWDDYAGRNNSTRAKARTRQRTHRDKERLRREAEEAAAGVTNPPQSRGGHGDGHGDAGVTVTRQDALPSRGRHAQPLAREGRGERGERTEASSKTGGGGTREPVAARSVSPAATPTVRLTVAANRAITERFGEQTSPLLSGSSSATLVASQLADAGIPLDFAAQSIARQVLDQRSADVPKSLTYFLPGITRHWAQQTEREAAALASPVSPLPATAEPRYESRRDRGLRMLDEQEARWAADPAAAARVGIVS